VACDGRADDEAGLRLGELAEALVALGARSALNLDGGGSTSLVCGGRLRNVPREEHGVALAGGRPVSTAIAFTRR
jgi:exopolysaccharide biosynthesis protein